MYFLGPATPAQCHPAALPLSRTPMDDETGRPHKRIKLEQSELATPDDVVNLSKPHLDIIQDSD